MPRSFSFDHFMAQKPTVSRSLKKKAKQKVVAAEQEAASARGGLHYGKRHAKTEQLARQRAEENAPPATKASGSAAPPTAAEGQSARDEDTDEAVKVAQAVEAGFIPAVPEPQIGQAPAVGLGAAAANRGVFDVLEDGREQLSRLASSAVEFSRAGLQLGRLSVELASLAVKGLRRPGPA